MIADQPSEFSRWIAVRQAEGRDKNIVANSEERAALARRFGIVAIDRLEADVALSRDGAQVRATGRLTAAIVQSCAVSGEDLAVTIDAPLSLLFVPRETIEEEEIELAATDCDEIPYLGDRFDLGEAIAQGLALEIDPFATGPQADDVRREVGLAEPERENPFAALKQLGDNE